MDKIFADKKGQAVFRCPQCGFERIFDASGYRERDSRIKIRCRCGKVSEVLVDFREFFRKEVYLPGECDIPRLQHTLPITVRDLSLGGVKFEFTTGLGADIALRKDEPITVRFRLDTSTQPLLTRKALLTSVHANFCGAHFIRGEYDKELGFYLMR